MGQQCTKLLIFTNNHVRTYSSVRPDDARRSNVCCVLLRLLHTHSRLQSIYIPGRNMPLENMFRLERQGIRSRRGCQWNAHNFFKRIMCLQLQLARSSSTSRHFYALLHVGSLSYSCLFHWLLRLFLDLIICRCR